MSETPIQDPPVREEPKKEERKRRNVFLIIYRGIAAVFRFIRVSIANLLIILLFFLILALATSGEPEPEVKQGSILVFEPKQSLVEQTSNPDPILDLLLAGSGLGETRVKDVVRALRYARTDDRIVALEIRPHRLLGANLVHLNTLSDALREFKESGKKVVAFSNSYTQSQYFLASHADNVAMHPYGELIFTGFAFENRYFQALLEMLHVNVHTFRAGDFKSAVEPFTRNSMSPEVKASYEPILQQLWGNYLDHLAANREISSSQVNSYANGLAALLQDSGKDMATLAVDQGLIDDLLGPTQYAKSLENDEAISESGVKPPRISMSKYLEAIPNFPGTLTVESPRDDAQTNTGRIGLVTVSGALFDLPFGLGPDSGSSSSPVKHINSAARADVDALVLRIDSPGGSVFASEQIRMALRELSEKGTPIVVSMAATAASGGYWIAAEADLILAAESTITGSIGVFAMLPSVEDSLSRVGVHSDGAYSAPTALRLDPFTGISENDATIMQAMVDTSYDRFLGIVSNGREMNVDDVRPIAGGRIWTGLQAVENNLVDQIGGLDDAFDEAARLANLKKYRVREYKDQPTSLLLSLLEATGLESPVANSEFLRLVGDSTRIAREMWPNIQPRKVYALCDSCVSDFAF